MAYGRYYQEVVARGICPSCDQRKPDIDEQYSYGVYAGVMCGACARTKFRDQCGLGPEGQGRAEELDEPMEED